MMGVESITSISEDLRDAGAERVVKAETDHHLHGYWADYWTSNGQIWHQDDVHHMLLKYTQRIVSNTDKPVKVLVPLCGKTADLAYLG
mmetsp:Transcript_9097/g.13459  ORF Transcript_9097/g.13459 Transcript_9097/m.13459 type:complete len:88 (-) Transcript_9097:436-699(-)